MRKSTKILLSMRLTQEALEHLEEERKRVEESTGIKVSTTAVLEAIIAEHKKNRA